MAAALLIAAVAGLPAPVPTEPPSAFDSLNHFLAPITITPPDMHLKVLKGSVTLRNLKCSNFSIGDLSLPAAAIATGGAEMELVLSRLNVACSTDLDEAVPPLPKATNNSISFGAALNVTLRIALVPAPNTSAPGNIAVSDCGVSLPVLDAHCRPKLSPLCVFINTALPGIVKAVLNGTACNELKKAVSPTSKVSAIVNIAGLLLNQWGNPVAPEPSVADSEGYLSPIESQLAPFSKHGKIARLAGLIDFLPAKLIDWVVGLFTHGGRVQVPLHLADSVALPIDAGNLTLTLTSVELTGLNQFTTLKPLKLESGFTWRSQIALKKASVAIGAKIGFVEGASVHGVPPGSAVDVQLTVPVSDLAFDVSVLVAMNKSRVCEVSGEQTSSIDCLLWPIVNTKGPAGNDISGLNITALEVSIGDFSAAEAGLGAGIDAAVAGALKELALAYKPALLKALPRGLSRTLQTVGNAQIFARIGKMQAQSPCAALVAAPAVSRVCVVNNAWFVMSYALHSCGSDVASHRSSFYPIGSHRCLELDSVDNLANGSLVRVAVDAVAGKRELADAALRYSPSSNVATYTCRGATFDYRCKLDSVTPITPGKKPEVSRICVSNDAAFVLRWSATDSVLKASSNSSGDYAVDQTRCIELSSIPGVQEGDEVTGTVKAVLGRSKELSTPVIYRNNSYGATFVCKGTTLFFHCNLLEAVW